MGGKGHHRSASNVNPNLNTNWVGYPGTWTAYVALLLLFWCCLYPILDYDAGRCATSPSVPLVVSATDDERAHTCSSAVTCLHAVRLHVTAIPAPKLTG